MAARVVCLRHDVEQEGLHVIVQRLVVQEQLGQETQVLAVDLGTTHLITLIGLSGLVVQEELKTGDRFWQ